MPVLTHTGLILTLTPDDPCSTTITTDDGRVLYVIRSKDVADSTRTEVYNGEKAVIASLQWSDAKLHAWKVTYCHQRAEPLHKWMRTSVNPLSRSRSFRDEAGRQYKWKGFSVGSTLELYTRDDGYKRPIASFQNSGLERKSEQSISVPAQLALSSRAEQIRDLVVCSFLFLEQEKRTLVGLHPVSKQLTGIGLSANTTGGVA